MTSPVTSEEALRQFRDAGAIMDGRFMLSMGLRSPVFIQKARVAIVENTVTTGLSSRETVDALQSIGANVLAVACLIDRSAGAADPGVPLIALADDRISAYEADKLPPELAAIPTIKPGSRGLS